MTEVEILRTRINSLEKDLEWALGEVARLQERPPLQLWSLKRQVRLFPIIEIDGGGVRPTPRRHIPEHCSEG